MRSWVKSHNLQPSLIACFMDENNIHLTSISDISWMTKMTICRVRNQALLGDIFSYPYCFLDGWNNILFSSKKQYGYGNISPINQLKILLRKILLSMFMPLTLRSQGFHPPIQIPKFYCSKLCSHFGHERISNLVGWTYVFNQL
jgi:hypothetical protein